MQPVRRLCPAVSIALALGLPALAGSTSSPFVRGDVNQDQSVNIADPIALLDHLFGSGSLTCEDAADCNDDGGVNIADAIQCLSFLFDPAVLALPAPFPGLGDDLTPDGLECLVDCQSGSEVNGVLDAVAMSPPPISVTASSDSISYTIPPFGPTVTATGTVCSGGCTFTLSNVNANYSPQPGSSTGTVTVSGTLAGPATVTVMAGVFINISCNVNASYSFTHTLTFTKSNPTGPFGVVSTSSATNVFGVSVSLASCGTAFNPFLSLLQSLFSGEIENALENSLDSFLENELNGLIDDLGDMLLFCES